MEPADPRALGSLEDGEPERRTPAPKKPLDVFLEEFEARLREHPGQAATSATAALEGRAEGAWRTPVESAERTGRRLPRRLGWRPSASPPLPAPPSPAEPDLQAPLDPPSAGPSEPAVLEPGELSADAPTVPDAGQPPETPALDKRRRRPRRHHRHR